YICDIIKKRELYKKVSFSIDSFNPKVMEMLQNDLKKSSTIKNALGIIINSYYSGGDVAVTMMDLSETVLSLWNIGEEKKSVLSQQIIVMYSIFVIFIVIIIVLYYVFRPIASMETGEIGAGDFSISVQTTNYCDPEMYPQIYPLCTIGYIFGYKMEDVLTYFKLLLFFTAIVEAASIGLMIGVIQDNRIQAGLKHAAILVTITLLVFALVM
ncbi:MAG: hypothetical protein GXN99_00510, partial [Candidatus Nanohaloarchaeota archaeon]|nr:hypothetical protein [Candidatus Nanohaloarchaeota archaeon]